MKKQSINLLGIIMVSFFLSIICVNAEQNNSNNAYAGISFFDFFMIFVVASGFFIFLRKNYMKS
ncbi:MAG: hypothetical protein ACTSYA_02570 [Candidatus Kariarchaeaceae archaeon]